MALVNAATPDQPGVAAATDGQPKPIRDIAWKGRVRLCARYRRLVRTGKPANVVTTAIARELTGFVWAIARQVPPAAK
jgi:transposase